MGSRLRGFTLLCACTVAACSGNGKSDAGIAHVGQAAPNWTDPSVAGQPVSLSDLRGKAVYLNLFASWCEPCNEEAPAINAVQRDLGPRGLQVIGVDILENSRKAQEFQAEHRLIYPVLVDSGTVRDQYRVNGLPVHVFINRAGIVERIVVGQMSPSEIRSSAERLL